MKRFTYKSKYDSYDNCYLLDGKYHNGNLGLEIWSEEHGPIAKVTTYVSMILGDDYIAVKNYSENEGMDEFLVSSGIVDKDPINYVASGFVDIPIYRLTEYGKGLIVTV